MSDGWHQGRSRILHMGMSELWSGDLGLTLVTISLVILIFIILPLQGAGLPGRLHTTPLLHQSGSVLTTLTLLLYARIVVLVMFRGRSITWGRIQGGVCAYLLLGLAWSSLFEFVEELRLGSFHFLSAPANIDALTSKLTYFRFSTLTTVGFGDVTPSCPLRPLRKPSSGSSFRPP